MRTTSLRSAECARCRLVVQPIPHYFLPCCFWRVFTEIADCLEQTTGINKLVGDSAKPGLFQRQSSFIGALKKNFGAAGDEGAAPSLRFAPQWTAPEMLRTPMGVPPACFLSYLRCLIRVVRNIQCSLGYLQVGAFRCALRRAFVDFPSPSVWVLCFGKFFMKRNRLETSRT